MNNQIKGKGGNRLGQSVQTVKKSEKHCLVLSFKIICMPVIWFNYSIQLSIKSYPYVSKILQLDIQDLSFALVSSRAW